MTNKTDKDYQSASFVPAQPPRQTPPLIDLGSVFGEQPAQRGSHGSHYERGLEFLIKFIPLSIILLVLAIGLTVRSGMDVTFGIVLFGVMVFVGYWLLAFMENVFEPTSGHVVRYFFSWLVARQYIDSNERLSEQANQLEYMRQYNEWRAHQMIAAKAAMQLEDHSQPQDNRNRLANYEQSPTLPSRNLDREYAYPEDILVPSPHGNQPTAGGKFKDEARSVILDFTIDLYANGLLNEDGYIDNQEVTVPWSQRGLKQFDFDLRKLIESLSSDLSELFVYNANKHQWQVNLKRYPTIISAIDYIDTVPTRKSG